ncbi:MAG: hypothetical protein ABTD50_17945 [Polyangiaceae bacterium]
MKALDSRGGKKEPQFASPGDSWVRARLSIQFDVGRHLRQKLASERDYVTGFVSAGA